MSGDDWRNIVQTNILEGSITTGSAKSPKSLVSKLVLLLQVPAHHSGLTCDKREEKNTLL